MIFVATAGWSIPRASAGRFPGAGTHLQRYARVLRGVEINSSFYRDHGLETYQRWAGDTPRNFRFAVKLPQRMTHEARLRAPRKALAEFLTGIAGLGRRLGPLVVQLPPSLQFDARVANRFFGTLRDQYEGAVVCEPRHASWFASAADRMLVRHQVGRVAADPAVVPIAAEPGGWPGIVYYRLHGSPRKYWSVYETARLQAWLLALQSVPRGVDAWCVFDNTAASGAAANALWMLDKLQRPEPAAGLKRRGGK